MPLYKKQTAAEPAFAQGFGMVQQDALALPI